MLDYSRSFIETQFPVSKVSKESYKERKSVQGQTLTGLGKWWGRKPLILVRATLLGLLLPVSDNLKLDREVFLKILTMDEEGLWLRKSRTIDVTVIFEYLNVTEKDKYFQPSNGKKPVYANNVGAVEKDYLQKIAFSRMSYDEKLGYCERPENIKLNSKESWDFINSHLETNATSLNELVLQIAQKRFGHKVKVGDCFAGGGSVPFESARIGADIYASDLNPVAIILNWLSLSLLSMNSARKRDLLDYQSKVFNSVDEKIMELGIETNEHGHRANAYVYCSETICPECGQKIPLTTSWIIGIGSRTIAVPFLLENGEYKVDIVQGASDIELRKAKETATVTEKGIKCLRCMKETPIASLREINATSSRVSRGLRLWEKDEFLPRADDVFQEKLLCVRYEGSNGRYYVSPSNRDLKNEADVISYLSENFFEWQNKGYLPSAKIESGINTDQPIRERGWQYWHQLFNPRQLLYLGLLSKYSDELSTNQTQSLFGIAAINRVSNWSSKLCQWGVGQARESIAQTFYNQAFNTMLQYGVKGFTLLKGNWFVDFNEEQIEFAQDVKLTDARNVDSFCDIWITDPPYADAVNYHELTEFFLAWNDRLLQKTFPSWYCDSKRILAVKGVGKSFNESMIDIYKNLSNCMPSNGYQVVMFTHQDVKVWSELAMILWSANLRVVSAWNVATETEAGGLKEGNYVKGTVLLTLKKQTSSEMAFQDELYDEIKFEVRQIIDSMRNLDDRDDPDFTDGDYLLASYAATLKVLTAYKKIEGVDVPYWLSKPRDNKEENPIEMLINKAVRIAYDYLIPDGFDKSHWADLKPQERFYIRGIELEMNQSHKISAYQELARGFGVTDYKDMFADFKANSVRLKTPREYKMTFLNSDGFGSTLTRHLLVAINETTLSQSTVEGRNYLRTVYNKGNEYWYKKPLMQEILSFISKLEYVDHMPHWKEHAYSAKILKEALKNEGT